VIALGVLGMLSILVAGTIVWVQAIRRHRDPLRQLPTHAIARVAENQLVRVRGTVSASQPLTAPLTGRPCAYWRIELFVSRAVDRDDYRAADHVELTIADDTGVARVLLERARVDIVADIVLMGRASDLTPAHRTTLAAHGWQVPAAATLELCEAIIALDAPIDVAGVATREPNLAPDGSTRAYRDAQPTLLVFSGEPVILGDRRDRRYLA
jgi:hypothetical protein